MRVCALVAGLVCLVSGCGKDARAKAPPAPSAPSAPSHFKDPALKAQLANQRAERDAIVRARQTIVAKMEDLVATKYKGDMKAAANDPEMASLIRRARDIETNLSSNRAHTAEMIRASALKGASARKNSISKKEVKQ